MHILHVHQRKLINIFLSTAQNKIDLLFIILHFTGIVLSLTHLSILDMIKAAAMNFVLAPDPKIMKDQRSWRINNSGARSRIYMVIWISLESRYVTYNLS